MAPSGRTKRGGRVRPGPGRDEEAVRRYVESMARFLADWGFPRMAARILLLLMAAEEPALTAATIAERLAISPAAVSGGVRYLQQLGLVEREPVPGSRRDRYRVPEHTWYQSALVKGGLFATLAKLAAEGTEAAGGPDTTAGARLAEMSDFYEFLHAEVNALLERWRQRQEATTGRR